MGEVPAERLRGDVLAVLEAAVRAVDPYEAVAGSVALEAGVLRIGRHTYPLASLGKIIVVGAGKAGTPMAAAVYEVLGDRIAAGCANVKHGHAAAGESWRLRCGSGIETKPPGKPAPGWAAPGRTASRRTEIGPVQIVEAGHPVPDEAGVHGAEQIAALLGGLSEHDLVIAVISGGGSALLPLPVPGVSLEDYRALTDLLLRSGADIAEVNRVRKHCSRLQGGQLARLAAPARVATLILSDVVGSPLDVIASGPTVPDPSTFADAWTVLERYDLADTAPAGVREHLRRGLRGEIPDTPKKGDRLFERVENTVVADNEIAARAAVAAAGRLGYHGALLTTFLQGEAREVGKALAGLAQGVAVGSSDFPPPVCLVLGGETTVTVRGSGIGGRNQELALSAALALDGYPLPRGRQVAVASLGTDGTDGPTDAAGALALGDTLARARALGLDARLALDNNDSYPFFSALGDLLITGPTQTNVNDLICVLVA